MLIDNIEEKIILYEPPELDSPFYAQPLAFLNCNDKNKEIINKVLVEAGKEAMHLESIIFLGIQKNCIFIRSSKF